MRHYLRGLLVLAVACALLPIARAWAAPERLGDLVPDAVPDQEGAWSFAWGREAVNLEGPLNSEQTARDYFKLRYTFSPKVAASLRYTYNDMAGGFGLVTPVLNQIDSSNSFTVNLDMNMMYQPRVNEDKANNIAFAAGSSFGMGVTGTQYTLKSGTLDQSETLIAAYLVYSTDLTPEMRAHTYFSSGRLSGDAYTGSMNRVGAGLDYMLIPGRHPLELMANGVLDIYNFRQPSFNTSRVSRFDVGLRYRIANDWFATLGWATVNDSESNNSGSGLMAGVNYVTMPKEKPPCPPAAPPAEAPAETPPAPPAAAAPAPDSRLAGLDAPPLMASVDTAPAPDASAGDPGLTFRDDGQPGSKSAAAAPADELAIPPVEAAPQNDMPADEGIIIPALPESAPLPTPESAVMLRAGVADTRPARRQTSASDVMLRPPVGPLAGDNLGALVAEITGAAPGAVADPATGGDPGTAPEVGAEPQAAGAGKTGILELAALPPEAQPADAAPGSSAEQDAPEPEPETQEQRDLDARLRRYFSSRAGKD